MLTSTFFLNFVKRSLLLKYLFLDRLVLLKAEQLIPQHKAFIYGSKWKTTRSDIDLGIICTTDSKAFNSNELIDIDEICGELTEYFGIQVKVAFHFSQNALEYRDILFPFKRFYVLRTTQISSSLQPTKQDLLLQIIGIISTFGLQQLWNAVQEPNDQNVQILRKFNSHIQTVLKTSNVLASIDQQETFSGSDANIFTHEIAKFIDVIELIDKCFLETISSVEKESIYLQFDNYIFSSNWAATVFIDILSLHKMYSRNPHFLLPYSFSFLYRLLSFCLTSKNQRNDKVSSIQFDASLISTFDLFSTALMTYFEDRKCPKVNNIKSLPYCDTDFFDRSEIATSSHHPWFDEMSGLNFRYIINFLVSGPSKKELIVNLYDAIKVGDRSQLTKLVSRVRNNLLMDDELYYLCGLATYLVGNVKDFELVLSFFSHIKTQSRFFDNMRYYRGLLLLDCKREEDAIQDLLPLLGSNTLDAALLEDLRDRVLPNFNQF